jgi:tRNA-intron endonuclease
MTGEPGDLAARPPIARTAPASGLWRRDRGSLVLSSGEASQIHGRGYYGSVQSGGSLQLDPFETLYLVETERLTLRDRRGRDVDFPSLLRMVHGRRRGGDLRYLVYRDLRQRGYVVRLASGPLDFAVLPRGGSWPKTPSRYWVRCLSERSRVRLSDLVSWTEQASSARKTLLLAVIDEESDLTYYRIGWVRPRGSWARRPQGGPYPALFLGDRITVLDTKGVSELTAQGFYGCAVGRRLELSLLEALYLLEEGILELRDGARGQGVPLEDFRKRAQRVERDLFQRLPVYRHLRASGLIPKTGFKYGTHFRAYERDPEATHARYLIHTVAPEESLSWPEVSRGVRLAQGVRKEFFLAWTPVDGTPRYLQLERIRP